MRLASLREHVLGLLVHDVRTPLGVILGNAELLLEELAGPLTPKQLRLLGAIQRQAAALEEATESLRQAALATDPIGLPDEPESARRRASGRRVLRIRPGTLPPSLGPTAAQEALLAAHAALGGSGIRTLSGVPGALLVPVSGDLEAFRAQVEAELGELRPRIRGVRRELSYIIDLDGQAPPGQMIDGATG